MEFEEYINIRIDFGVHKSNLNLAIQDTLPPKKVYFVVVIFSFWRIKILTDILIFNQIGQNLKMSGLLSNYRKRKNFQTGTSKVQFFCC